MRRRRPSAILSGAGLAMVLLLGTPALRAMTFDWAQSFGDASAYQTDAGHVAVDTAGNLILAGGLSGAADFGGGPVSSAGGSDVFVAKFDPDGGHLWSHVYGDSHTDLSTGVSLDPAGNVLVTGIFSGTIVFDGVVHTNVGGIDSFLAKFSPEGTYLWSRSFGADVGFVSNHTLVVDSTGDILIAGAFQDTVDFGGGDLVCESNYDLFLAKFDPDGGHLWSRRFDDDLHTQSSIDIAVDVPGNIYLTGRFSYGIDLGGGFLVEAGGGYDMYLAKLDPGGAHVWSERYGGPAIESALDIAVDIGGNVVVAGVARSGIDFGAGLETDVFLAKFGSDASLVWSRSFTQTVYAGDEVFGAALDTDPTGNIFMAGTFAGEVHICGLYCLATPCDGDVDGYVAQFNPDGQTVWVRQLWDTDWIACDAQVCSDVVADRFGNIALAGRFLTSINFVDDYSSPPLTSSGGWDYFTAKFSPGPPPPPPPTNMAVAYAGDGNLVSWIPSPGAAYYLIYRSDAEFVDPSPELRVALVQSAAGPQWLDRYGNWSHHYLMTAADANGVASDAVAPSSVSSSDELPPRKTRLCGNMPNPFNPQTTIAFELPRQEAVTLRVFDVGGRLVRVLIDGQVYGQGRHQATWRGKTDSGRQCASGTYFCRLETAGHTETKSMVLVK